MRIRARPYAGLTVRPMVGLGWLWLAGMFAGVSVEAPDGPAAATLRGLLPALGNDPALMVTLWRLAIVIPAATSFVASATMLDLFKGGFAWMLPRVRERLLVPYLVTGLVAAMPIPVVVGIEGPWTAGVACIAVGLVAFSLASTLTRAKTGGHFLGGLLGLYLLWKGAPWLIALSHRAPLVLALIACSVATLTLLSVFSREANRAWVEVQALQRSAMPGFLKAKKLDGRVWTRSLFRATNWQWLRAGGHEVYGHSRMGFLGNTFLLVALWWILTVVIGDADFQVGLTMVPLMVSWSARPMLRPGGLYPISRRRRATVNILSGAFALTVAILLTWTGFAALDLIFRGADHVRAAFTPHSVNLATSTYPWAVGFLWSSTRHPLLSYKVNPTSLVWMFGSMTVVMGGGIATAALIFQSGWFPSMLAKLGIWLAVAATLQAVHWLMVRRYFLRGNLR